MVITADMYIGTMFVYILELYWWVAVFYKVFDWLQCVNGMVWWSGVVVMVVMVVGG